jgi:hypothetical protein
MVMQHLSFIMLRARQKEQSCVSLMPLSDGSTFLCEHVPRFIDCFCLLWILAGTGTLFVAWKKAMQTLWFFAYVLIRK